MGSLHMLWAQCVLAVLSWHSLESGHNALGRKENNIADATLDLRMSKLYVATYSIGLSHLYTVSI